MTNEKLTELADVIAWCQRNDIPADVVGRWVWVRFDAKPSESIRDSLKAVGFRWVKHRGEWAHNCGWVSRRGPGRPRDKYGSVPVASIDTEAA